MSDDPNQRAPRQVYRREVLPEEKTAPLPALGREKDPVVPDPSAVTDPSVVTDPSATTDPERDLITQPDLIRKEVLGTLAAAPQSRPPEQTFPNLGDGWDPGSREWMPDPPSGAFNRAPAPAEEIDGLDRSMVPDEDDGEAHTVLVDPATLEAEQTQPESPPAPHRVSGRRQVVNTSLAAVADASGRPGRRTITVDRVEAAGFTAQADPSSTVLVDPSTLTSTLSDRAADTSPQLSPPTGPASPLPSQQPAELRATVPVAQELDEAHEATVMLDPEMTDRLMALRAQQDQALKQRFGGEVVVMFTDLVGSTAYYEKHGDLAGRQKMLTHNALLFPIIRTREGTIIKTIGDAIMCCFHDVQAALTAAVEMQQALGAFNESCINPDDEIHIRIGINAGPAIAEDGDLHGDAVNVAARVEAKADADEILVSEDVMRASGRTDLQLKGRVHFKGKAERVNVYLVPWGGERPASSGSEEKLVGKRYRVGKALGRGPLGVVHEALDTQLKVPVAIKILHEYITADVESVDAFSQRFSTMAALRHPAIVRLVDCAPREADEVFYVMDRVDGVDLAKWMSQQRAVDPTWAARFIHQLGQAVAYAHGQGVIHANIKPENVFVTPQGAPRLSDFGIAAVHRVQGTRTGTSVASPAFQAPEQITGGRAVPQTDVYALGALLYYVLAGRPPFNAAASLKTMQAVVSGLYPPVGKIRPGLPPGLVKACERAMSTRPEDRHGSVGELLVDISRFAGEAASPAGVTQGTVPLSSEPLDAQAPTFVQEGRGELQTLRRALIGVSVGAGGLLLLLLAMVIYLAFYREPDGAAPNVIQVQEISPAPGPAAEEAAGEEAAPVDGAPAGPVETGRLVLTSNPPGADIFINGERIGRTGKLKSIELSAGVHRLRITHKNRQPHLEEIQIESGRVVKRAVSLKPVR